MRSRLIGPHTTTLTLSDGDWILVKSRLNAGEHRRAFAALSRLTPDGQRTVDPLQTGQALILAYLLDWSFTDEDGTRIAIRGRPDAEVSAALDAIDFESWCEIKDAVERHQTDQEAASTARKNIPAGEPRLAAPSPLPDGAAGDSSGSTNSTPMSTTS